MSSTWTVTDRPLCTTHAFATQRPKTCIPSISSGYSSLTLAETVMFSGCSPCVAVAMWHIDYRLVMDGNDKSVDISSSPLVAS